MGEKDIMHELVKILGAEQLFWRVKIKPGAPTLAAYYEDMPIVALSGNPFGAAANFELLVRSMIAKMTGNSIWQVPRKKMTMQSNFYKGGGARRFLRARREGHKVWLRDGNHASGAMASMIGSNCFVEIDPSMEQGARIGDEVWVHLL